MKSILYLVLVSSVLLVSCNKTPELPNGKELIKQMHEKYSGKWYKNFTFSQGVEQFKNDSLINKEVWHEAYKAPSNLIIKFRAMTGGSGYLFNDDSLFIFAHHKLQASRKHINFLVTLGFDVYNQPVDKTVKTLSEVEFDTEKIIVSTLNGNDVYVVGVKDLIEENNHFFIDAEKLVFLKAVTFNNGSKREIIFKNYQMIENNLVATEVDFFTNGKLDMTEKYYNIKFPEDLPDSVFNKDKFLEATW